MKRTAKKDERVLVVVAHPDDEIIGCGGTMSVLARAGQAIEILVLGEGITSRQDQRAPSAVKKELAKLKADGAKAAKQVGAKAYDVLDFPDNRFDSVALLDVVKAVEARVKRFKPSRIFTHHPHDLNIDHGVTFRAVMTACRPMVGESVREILCCEIPSSTEWQAPLFEPQFRPNCFYAITEQDLNNKVRAMEAYRSERREYPHPRSPRALRVLAEQRGISTGLGFAEAFEVVRSLR